MNLPLNRELEELIQTKVESGKYASATDVIEQALRLLEERDRESEEKMEALRQKLDASIAEIEKGNYVVVDSQTLPEIIARIKREGREELTHLQKQAG